LIRSCIPCEEHRLSFDRKGRLRRDAENGGMRSPGRIRTKGRGCDPRRWAGGPVRNGREALTWGRPPQCRKRGHMRARGRFEWKSAAKCKKRGHMRARAPFRTNARAPELGGWKRPGSEAGGTFAYAPLFCRNRPVFIRNGTRLRICPIFLQVGSQHIAHCPSARQRMLFCRAGSGGANGNRPRRYS